jgi:hypothetical protein
MEKAAGAAGGIECAIELRARKVKETTALNLTHLPAMKG